MPHEHKTALQKPTRTHQRASHGDTTLFRQPYYRTKEGLENPVHRLDVGGSDDGA